MRAALASLVLCAVLATPVPAQAEGLTIKTGETWVFSLFRGQPIKAHKANPSARPAPGQILVTVRSMIGTTMTISSNNPIAYTYKAELVGEDKAEPARSCTLPADAKLSFEHWPQAADAVRLSGFKPARNDGKC